MKCSNFAVSKGDKYKISLKDRLTDKQILLNISINKLNFRKYD